ncbi:heterocyst frequency control protein PatD [Gloeomargaritales cyanobacterium VI4D9]|nr:heterocyst frequency control protein PatD [Gloeomargaritales cyanobacterium VI4D9]
MPLPPVYLQVQQFLATFGQKLTMTDYKTVVTEIENFITEIPRTFDDMEPLARSLGVEIHKQFHLLKNDLLFWHAARQMETKSQRWQNIQQRLATLNLYVQQLLSLEHSPQK